MVGKGGGIQMVSAPNRSWREVAKASARGFWNIGKSAAFRVGGNVASGVGTTLNILDGFTGQEEFLRQGINECNASHPNATDKVSVTRLGSIRGSNVGDVRAYVSRHQR
jgi:hypothetical protein